MLLAWNHHAPHKSLFYKVYTCHGYGHLNKHKALYNYSRDKMSMAEYHGVFTTLSEKV